MRVIIDIPRPCKFPYDVDGKEVLVSLVSDGYFRFGSGGNDWDRSSQTLEGLADTVRRIRRENVEKAEKAKVKKEREAKGEFVKALYYDGEKFVPVDLRGVDARSDKFLITLDGRKDQVNQLFPVLEERFTREYLGLRKSYVELGRQRETWRVRASDLLDSEVLLITFDLPTKEFVAKFENWGEEFRAHSRREVTDLAKATFVRRTHPYILSREGLPYIWQVAEEQWSDNTGVFEDRKSALKYSRLVSDIAATWARILKWEADFKLDPKDYRT